MSTISTFCNMKFMTMREKLSSIEEKDSSLLLKSQASILVCAEYLEEIKKEVVTRGFTSEKEEINFFKNIKTKFSSEYIFHIDLYNFRKGCPDEEELAMKAFVRREQKRISHYLEDHKHYDEYFKLGLDYNDHIYFVRGEYNYQYYADSFLPDADPAFTTMIDQVFSRIIAGRRLHEYLSKIVDTGDLSFKTAAPWVNGSEETIKWTGKVAELQMIIYAFHELKVINNGTINISEVTRQMGKFLGIEMGDPHDTFSKVKTRKGGAVNFLQKLQEALQRRIEQGFH